MDGVLMRGAAPIPGAADFIGRLVERGAKFLLLTNNSLFTPRDLRLRLERSGLEVPPESIYTSAMATARFLHSQHPEGTAYVIGESGLTTALHEVGYTLTDTDPRYVVIGETASYSFERIARAIRLVAAGASFIATNPDVKGPSETGLIPATGAMAALISSASGVKPYFVGKPNPLMMRTALNAIDAHSEDSVMIGDNMDTDVIMGIESGLETILVLSGVTRRVHVDGYSYSPTRILDSVADIEP
ncbi:HAD-IIA family hydrolase [Rubrobacter marinus]|uniref:HAD-IIA family hydrolase n=1 Tax=Rubrobacter marinus TaxID=2653852 RepID=A0A6G8Q2R3_9ACTN|nr:HAD-IIA family hydrolase [Rubrobacter marinus]